MLPVSFCPRRVFVRLYTREISHSFTSLNKQRPTAPKRPRAPPLLRTPNTTAAKVEPLSQHHRRLLPYDLSTQLITLCRRGDTGTAVHMLQNAPKNAQNVKVWNTLIKQCLVAEKYKLAFNVFIDMKRRGFMPNIRTYATLMSGYAAVEDWEPLTKQLEFVHSIYGQLKEQLKTSSDLFEDRAIGSTVPSTIHYSIALYIGILGKAGEYQKALEVFNDFDTHGPLAPRPKVYSAILCPLAGRVDLDDAQATAQAVSDAKYVWRQHIRSLERQPGHYIEPRSVDAVIKILSRGEPSDHELMFDILRDICGLPRPGEDCPPAPPKVEPNEFILTEVLDGCTAAGRSEMAVHYAQIVMGSPKLRPILRVWHLPKFLRAHSVLAKGGSTFPARSEDAAAWIDWFMSQDHKESIPNHHALTNALRLCHRCGDLPSALLIARVMLEGSTRASLPTKAWVYLLRLAIVAPPNDKLECLELLIRHKSVLDAWESDEPLGAPEMKDHVSLASYIAQLLRTPLALEAAGGPDTIGIGRSESWDIRRRAKSFLQTSFQRDHRFHPR